MLGAGFAWKGTAQVGVSTRMVKTKSGMYANPNYIIIGDMVKYYIT